MYNLNSKQYIEINFALSNQIIYDLIQVAQDPNHDIVTVVKQSLIDSGFFDYNGKMDYDIKNIILSTIILTPFTGLSLKSEHFYINNPIIELVNSQDINAIGEVSKDIVLT